MFVLLFVELRIPYPSAVGYVVRSASQRSSCIGIIVKTPVLGSVAG
jgi:hypothetical protein